MTNPDTSTDPSFLAEALQEADLRVLLMALFQITGDRRWLEAPYTPKRDVKLIADEDAGIPPAIQADIRAAALHILTQSDIRPAMPTPDEALMIEMMGVCLGEDVPQDYAGMMREEMGFADRQITWAADTPPDGLAAMKPVVIVGAGASGIALGANLETLGIPYIILEQNDEVGGTWLVNRYPGCGVDTPNHAYSFSFGDRYRWSRYFSARDQIQDYLERSATDFGVRARIRFGTTLTGAVWRDAEQCWRLTCKDKDGTHSIDAFALVTAVGQLSLPAMPVIDGIDSFDGPLFHSSRWPDDLDVAGKRVAVIGTGASSMQIVPTIADDVASLTVYQRSAQWARPIPRYHDEISEGSQWLLEHVPFYAQWYRFCMLWRYGDGLHPTLQKDPAWPHPERALNRTNDRHREQMTAHIEEKLATRPDLIADCLPTYPPYGKRILLDNGWYDALVKPTVDLVTDPIDRITADGVTTADGVDRPADIIVLATGFQVSVLAARLNITGKGGQTLADAWAGDNPTAHLGIAVPDFPNLFCMQGPNTGLGHGGSAIFQSECQSRYIAVCLTRMIGEGIGAISVRPAVVEDYVRRVDEAHERMIWTHPGMSTYYRNRFGRVVSVMPWRLVDYWAMTHDPDFAEYDLDAAHARHG